MVLEVSRAETDHHLCHCHFLLYISWLCLLASKHRNTMLTSLSHLTRVTSLPLNIWLRGDATWTLNFYHVIEGGGQQSYNEQVRFQQPWHLRHYYQIMWHILYLLKGCHMITFFSPLLLALSFSLTHTQVHTYSRHREMCLFVFYRTYLATVHLHYITANGHRGAPI